MHRKVWMMGIVITALAASGCGRRSQLNSNAVDSEAVQGHFNLARVKLDAEDLQVGNSLEAERAADGIATKDLVVRTESYTNPNDLPVTIWLRASGRSWGAFGICNLGRAQYRADLGMLSPKFRGVEPEAMGDGWLSFQVAPKGSVAILWVASGSWAWIQGPIPAPGESCNESSPQRGWAQFRLSGSLNEEIRVSAPDVQEPEATTDKWNLDHSRVWILATPQDSVDLQWGS